MAKFNTKRQTVYAQDTLSHYEMGDASRLADVIAKLVALQEKHGPDAKFDFDIDSGECSATVACIISSEHVETDEEYNKRFEQHKAIEKHINQQAYLRKKQREEQDRKEFARLSKKFAK